MGHHNTKTYYYDYCATCEISSLICFVIKISAFLYTLIISDQNFSSTFILLVNIIFTVFVNKDCFQIFRADYELLIKETPTAPEN